VSTEPNIKYRVTGAMVLIALAVIFLPLILDGHKKNQVLDSRIPDKPISGEIVLINIEDLQPDVVIETEKAELKNTENTSPEVLENKTVSEVIISKKKNTLQIQKEVVAQNTPQIKIEVVAQKTPEKRQNRPNFKSSAFVIQLGSFGNKANANKLVAKLKAAGYKAYLKEAKTNGKIINRVLVGPDLKRQQAESKIDALNKLSGLKSIIVAYDPLRH